MIEIERKFLVRDLECLDLATERKVIAQGYLSTHPERTVRVRIAGDVAYLTVKGESFNEGVSRFEWEREIPLVDARALLAICEPSIIEKIRYLIQVEDWLFEIDEFLGENKGLYLAEVELKSPDENFKRPAWLGQEVTGDARYYNSFLASKPFTKW